MWVIKANCQEILITSGACEMYSQFLTLWEYCVIQGPPWTILVYILACKSLFELKKQEIKCHQG